MSITVDIPSLQNNRVLAGEERLIEGKRFSGNGKVTGAIT